MNSEKLAEVSNKLFKAEQAVNTQNSLNQLMKHLGGLVNQPNNPEVQTALSEAREKFRGNLASLISTFPPKDLERVGELDPSGFFADELADRFDQIIEANAMTPEVARSEIETVSQNRKQFIDALGRLVSSLEFFELGYSELDEGSVEIGVQIPREMFGNNLTGLRNELRDFSLIAGWFSEAVAGERKEITVESISTSDPLFMFSLADAATIAALAKAFEWALGCWEKVENIRKLRAETAASGEFSDEEIEEFFGSKVKATVENAVSEKLSDLSEEHQLENKPELKSHLETGLNWIVSKTEHGYSVELRLPAFDQELEIEQEQEDGSPTSPLSELRRIQGQLVFPKFEGNTVLEIPDLSDDASESE